MLRWPQALFPKWVRVRTCTLFGSCVGQVYPWREAHPGTGTSQSTLPVFKIDFGAEGILPVCRYAFAMWHGASKSAMKALTTAVSRSAPFASPSSAGIRSARGPSRRTVMTREWLCKFFDWRVGEYDPADGGRTLARFVIRDLYLTTYCREYKLDAVSESHFGRLFHQEFTRRRLRWKTENGHGKCVECTRLRGVTKDPKMRLTAEAEKARAST
jgi:hypothetical protein